MCLQAKLAHMSLTSHDHLIVLVIIHLSCDIALESRCLQCNHLSLLIKHFDRILQKFALYSSNTVRCKHLGLLTENFDMMLRKFALYSS